MDFAQFKIVVIDSFYDHVANPLAKKIFMKGMTNRFRCYKSYYPFSILPADTTDFFATQFLVGLDSPDEFDPIMGFKMVTQKRCHVFNVPFPPLALVQSLQLPEHTKAVQGILDHCEANQQTISYISSLFVDPDKKKDRAFTSTLFDLFLAINYWYSQENQIDEGLAGTTVRFKTNRLTDFLGYAPVQSHGKILPPVAVPFVGGDLSQLQYRTYFTTAAQKLAEQYQELWKEKLIFTSKIKTDDTVAA